MPISSFFYKQNFIEIKIMLLKLNKSIISSKKIRIVNCHNLYTLFCLTQWTCIRFKYTVEFPYPGGDRRSQAQDEQIHEICQCSSRSRQRKERQSKICCSTVHLSNFQQSFSSAAKFW